MSKFLKQNSSDHDLQSKFQVQNFLVKENALNHFQHLIASVNFLCEFLKQKKSH